MLDELAHAGAEHLDAEFIAGFDRKQGYPDAETDIAAFEAHGLGRGSAVVDFGAGTGQFAIPAARRFGQVTAVDVSPGMLAALAAKAAADGVTPPALECVRGGFLSYFPAGPVDGVYSRHALHQVPDFWKAMALRRIADMLRPGGVLRLRDLVLRLRARRGGRGLRRLARRRGRRPGRGVHGGRLCRAHPHRAQHVPLAARADARRGRP